MKIMKTYYVIVDMINITEIRYSIFDGYKLAYMTE